MLMLMQKQKVGDVVFSERRSFSLCSLWVHLISIGVS